MKRFLASCVTAILLPGALLGQLTIVSTSPTNNAKNVPLSTTMNITFSAALDTVAMNRVEVVFSNIHNGHPYFSPDAKSIIADVQLDSNTTYFVSSIYAKAIDGSTLTAPFVFYFTTGSAFPPATVSGTIFSGSTGVSPQNSIVALSKNSVGENEPDFTAWAIVNNDGSFTIPYVAKGIYYPVAAKDVDGDGSVDPGNGVDVVAVGDSLVVDGSISGVNLTFVRFVPHTFSEAFKIADSLKAHLPGDCVLKRASSYRIDTLGRGESWNFDYLRTTASGGFSIYVTSFLSHTDTMDFSRYDWLKNQKTLSNPELAASSSTVITNVEAAGGKSFRTEAHTDTLEFQIEVTLGDQNWSEYGFLPHDTSKLYWGVKYVFGYYINNNEWITIKEKEFLCDFSSGAVVSVSAVGDAEMATPWRFELKQNYPNPFNPATAISYRLSTASTVRLNVYDILGREVAVLVNARQPAGEFTVYWNADGFVSGLYFYTLHAGSFTETKKMILLK